MAVTVETGLVYIHRTKPTKRFVGCGALIEGGLIATCRHVWREATNIAAGSTPEVPLEVELEYPRAREGGAPFRSPASLADACDDTQIADPLPDLVLLQPDQIPSGVMTLQLARQERHEVGSAYAHARLARIDPGGNEIWRDTFPQGRIDPSLTDEGLRQFTGQLPKGYWFTSGSSGSPVFLNDGQQLAGILSLSEIGANEGESPLHEAFVVPATTIRRFVGTHAARPAAESKGIDSATLQSILDAIGLGEVPIAEIPTRLRQFVDEARTHAAEPVRPSNDGADIEAVIGASRDKLRNLDIGGARDLLQTKILDEQEARTRRLVPLLREKAWLERLATDYDAAKSSLAELTALAPDDFWAWIELGDLWRTIGSLDDAARAYRAAEAAVRRTGTERDLLVSQERIGNVLVAQGDRDGALKAYQAGLAIAETLARRDPANTEWQRDLSVSQNKIGDVLVAQGDRAGALKAYQAGLAIRETLARRDPANTQWQRDLSVSHERIGEVLVAQGDRDGALKAHQAGLAIAETLARRDPANAEWQRDLSISQEKIGNVLIAQGDRDGALEAYQAALAIVEVLARRDPANTEWQRDLSISHDRIGNVLVAQGDRDGALKAYQAGLAIRETLARRDPANTEWQRDLSISHDRIGNVLVARGDRAGALKAYQAGLAIRETLARRDPGNTEWQRDLIISYVKISENDLSQARRYLSQALEIAGGLQARGQLAPVDNWMPDELARRLAAEK